MVKETALFQEVQVLPVLSINLLVLWIVVLIIHQNLVHLCVCVVFSHIKSRQRKYNHNCHLGEILPLKQNFLELTTLSNACARHIEHHEV
jgi:hypothetical protein